MILALLLAAAAVMPPVVPADPTALFQGDGDPIRFDPVCREFTVTTVAAVPACAARVAAGETAPSLAIAVQTFAKEPARTADALRVLERSLAARDHPAIHYLLGNAYATAETMKPDYARAVRHLSIAAERGNPAAADLLAKLLVEGKGAPRDVPRAVKLYERAMATGWPSAAVSLALLQLQGLHVPRDDDYGRRLLTAAKAAGVAQADQYAMLAGGIDKVHNIQLLPAAEDTAVTTRRFGPFDNPRIPPNFGFDVAFQGIHHAPYSDAAVLADLERTATQRPTPYLYELARRLADKDPARALDTYLLARLRTLYDASRCIDPAAMEAVRAWDMVVLPDLRFLLRAGVTDAVRDGAKRALAAESKLAGDTRPWWVCRSGMPAMQLALQGKPGPLALKPASEWPKLRQQARKGLEDIARPLAPN